MILLFACAPLLEDEVAVPWEVETTTLEGPLGFGRAVAVSEHGIAIASNDEVCLDDACWAMEDPLAVQVHGGLLMAANAEGISLFLDEPLHFEFEAPARAVSLHPDASWAAAFEGHVLLSTLESFAVDDPRAVDVESGLVLHCPVDGCVVRDLRSDEIVGEAGPDGSLASWRGEAWWSDPSVAEAGELRGASTLSGVPGDFLGRSIGGGYAGGVYNIDQAPGRLRLVSLDGAPTLALDRVAVGRPVVLAGDEQTLAIGLPHGPDLGRVHLLSRDAL